MPGYSWYELGVHQASRGAVLWIPAGYKRDGTKRGVVYLHGAGGSATSFLNPVSGHTNEAVMAQQIAAVYPTISIDCGVFGAGNTTDSDNWGNTNAQTEVGNAITRLQAAGGGGAKTGGVIMVGVSMGHALSMTYGQAHAANVTALVGILPVNDIDDIRDNNRGSYRSSISTAWGTAAWTANGTPALPAAANPAKTANQTNLLTVPQKLWYASDDAICTPATVTTIASNMPIITTVNMGTGGHTDASMGNVNITTLLAFLAANA